MEQLKYDVVIVGAGPAGIFTALKLNDKMPNLKVLIVDMGRDIASRVCPARKPVSAHTANLVLLSQAGQELVHSQMENFPYLMMSVVISTNMSVMKRRWH